MNALILTSNGIRRGVIGSANTTFGNTPVTLNVTVDGKVETYSPSNVYSADSMIGGDSQPSFPFLLVSKRDYKTVAKLAPHVHRPRTKKSA